MNYNQNNVCIVSYWEFIRYQQTGFLESMIRPDLYVLAEGDSWFHIGGNTGVFKERNLLDAISFNGKRTMIVNLALSGDVVSRMTDTVNGKLMYSLLKDYQWNKILLSASGNDLIDGLTESGGYKIGNKVLSIVQSHASPTSYTDFINQTDLDALLDDVIKNFGKLADKNKTRNKNTPIVLHTYDFPTPRNSPATLLKIKVGPWLYKAMLKKNVPKAHWVQITDHIFTALENTLATLNGNNSFNVIRTSSTLNRAASGAKGNSNDWLNETHPNAEGIRKLGQKINNAIHTIC